MNTLTDDLPDGVFLGLGEQEYFSQDRLGSSDLIRLHKSREGWWWASRYNPDRVDSKTDAQNYGSALHAILLEGLHAYETRFAVRPEQRDYPGALTTIPQIKAALAEEGVNISRGTSDYRLQDWMDAAAIHIPQRPVWPAILADFEARRGSREAVDAAEDRMLRFMLDAALEDDSVRDLLGYGQDVPALAEVSIFWTDAATGLRRRARLDKPVPHFTLDLKSVGNWQGRALKHALDDHIKRQGYKIQRADYHTARRAMHTMLREDDSKLSGGTDEERAWARAIAIRDMPFDWVWLFYQKPEASGRAPIIFPVYDDRGSPYHRTGYRQAVRALELYVECVERFGLGDRPDAAGRPSRPWSSVESVHHTDQDYADHLTLYPDNEDPGPVGSEEEEQEAIA